MNLPNKITLARVAMIPVFMIVLMCGAHYNWPFYALISAVIFAIASFTDGVDGHIARSRGLITDFGKFMDPLADKLLVSTALICFICLVFKFCRRCSLLAGICKYSHSVERILFEEFL